MAKAPTSDGDTDRRFNRDEEMRPDGEGRSPRPATEPRDSETRRQRPHTATDPATGAPNR